MNVRVRKGMCKSCRLLKVTRHSNSWKQKYLLLATFQIMSKFVRKCSNRRLRLDIISIWESVLSESQGHADWRFNHQFCNRLVNGKSQMVPAGCKWNFMAKEWPHLDLDLHLYCLERLRNSLCTRICAQDWAAEWVGSSGSRQKLVVYTPLCLAEWRSDYWLHSRQCPLAQITDTKVTCKWWGSDSCKTGSPQTLLTKVTSKWK